MSLGKATSGFSDEVFPDGTVLKKGTKVVYAIFSMGRMERIWGRDCREYQQERCLRGGRFMSESAYKFTGFNGGPRLCFHSPPLPCGGRREPPGGAEDSADHAREAWTEGDTLPKGGKQYS